MRLFLSSEGFGNYADRLISLVGSGGKAVYIMNAADLEANRSEYSKNVRDELERLGLAATELDLREYFTKQQDLQAVLEAKDFVWVAGGNTFVLNRAMHASGFDKVAKPLIEQNKIVFGGWSAGAIVATPSLRGVEHGDEPNRIPEGYDSRVLWEGMGLVSFYVVPHYNSDWWGDKARLMEHDLQLQNVQYETLEDGQVIVVDGDKVELLK